MAGVNKAGDGVEALARILRGYARRIEDLERKTKKAQRPKDEEIAPFSVVGDMEVSTSGVWRARKGGQVVAVTFESTDVGTDDTEFDVWVNGSAVGSTVVVPDTTTSDTFHIGSVRVKPGAAVQIDLTAAGMHPQAVIQVIMKG